MARQPTFCPGCGAALHRAYPCRHGAVGIYCLDCNSNWYIRDVAPSRETEPEARALADEFMTQEMVDG